MQRGAVRHYGFRAISLRGMSPRGIQENQNKVKSK